MHRPVTLSKPPEPARAGPWDASRSRFVLSAESLIGFAYTRQVETARFGSVEATHTTSGPSLHFFKGSEFIDPFGAARLGLDGVVGPGFTFGGSIGYSLYSGTSRTSGAGASSDEGSLDITIFVVVPRLGVLLAPSRYIGVWLRGGVGYTSVKIEEQQAASLHGWALVVDPMLVVTPLPHVGILVGPSLNIGLTGGQDQPSAPPGQTFSNTWSSYGVSGGIALLF